MLTSEFDYHLPQELIAQFPLPQRDQSRMMVCHRKSGEIRHARFLDLPGYFEKEDILVLNSSRVIPAKIWGKKEDGKSIEFLFIEKKDTNTWKVLCRPAKSVKLGDVLSFTGDARGRVVGIGPEGKRVIRFQQGDVIPLLKRAGFAPLPPYIKRKKEDLSSRSEDIDRYQTVFAQNDGSIAAPTAGLHFTPKLLGQLEDKGVRICRLSLDVGLATFQPVRVQKAEEHRMLTEKFVVPKQTAEDINNAFKAKRPITAVGTTSVRALESAIDQGKIQEGSFETSLFIFPGYDFKVVDRLLTNFHLPKSTLLMLVAAFAGKDFILEAYQEAVAKKYRFYSYGDCMLIL
jgi:S-adenosylmethionine:tRNA ribosyltransferase-isomerase